MLINAPVDAAEKRRQRLTRPPLEIYGQEMIEEDVC